MFLVYDYRLQVSNSFLFPTREFCFLLSMLKNDEAGMLKFLSKFLWIKVLSWLLYDENCQSNRSSEKYPIDINVNITTILKHLKHEIRNK